MVKDFQEFVEVIDERCERYGSIPPEFLNDAGREVVQMYGQVVSDICFAGSATELLFIIQELQESPQYDPDTIGARREFRSMMACLRRLAENEKGGI